MSEETTSNEKTVDENVSEKESGAEKLVHESDEKSVGPKGQSSKKNYSGIFFIISIVLFLGLIGLSYFSWLQQESLNTILDQQTQLSGSNVGISGELQEMNNRVADSLAEFSVVTETLAQQETRIETINDELSKIRINTNASQSGGVWQLSEASSLLRLAQRYLSIEQNIIVALDLYQNASSILSQIDDPAIARIRALLNSDISVLSNLRGIDTQGIFMRLSDLSEQIEMTSLGIDITPSEEFLANSEEDKINGALFELKNFLSQYFVIRKANSNPQVLMSDDEISFLRQNIQLQIEQAKLALLQGNASIYQDSLSKVLLLANNNIPENESRKMNIMRSLRELQTERITLSLPRLSDSLRSLEILQSNNVPESKE